MKKYYGYFIYDGEEYVIRFKVKGSMQWDKRSRCFQDNRFEVRSPEDMIFYAAIDTHWSNDKRCSFACLLSHEFFVAERARGVKRWKPKCEIIVWD